MSVFVCFPRWSCASYSKRDFICGIIFITTELTRVRGPEEVLYVTRTLGLFLTIIVVRGCLQTCSAPIEF